MATPKLRVCVVDDDASVCRALGRLIRSAGLGVETFLSAEQFLNNALAMPVDCLVLDVQLPGMGGLEVQSRLTGLGIRTPVIMITGHTDEQARMRALANGAIAYLQKPLPEHALLALLGDVALRLNDAKTSPAGAAK